MIAGAGGDGGDPVRAQLWRPCGIAVAKRAPDLGHTAVYSVISPEAALQLCGRTGFSEQSRQRRWDCPYSAFCSAFGVVDAGVPRADRGLGADLGRARDEMGAALVWRACRAFRMDAAQWWNTQGAGSTDSVGHGGG